MPLVQRYTGIAQGAMVLTGNALNCRQNSNYPPGTVYLSGAYISTNTALQVPGYPVGTTTQYLQNSSMAILNVLPGSTILFAQLMWVIKNPPAGTSNNPVNFTTPAGTTAVTATLSDDLLGYILWRAADVKALVQAGINAQPTNGQYIVGAVPSQNNPSGAVISAAWGLLVIYENSALPLRYFNINTGNVLVSNTQQSTFNFTGFATPTSGPVKGYLLMNYSDGDLADGAQVRVGPTAGTAVQIGNTSNPWNGLSPYSRINNMFPANVLNADTQDTNLGLLDTRGTFGNLNTNPYTSTAPAAARVNYDIVGLNISNTLVNNQTTLYTNIRFAGSGSASAQSISVQVDLNSPKITPTKTVNKSYADINDTLIYTISFTNTGTANADNLMITDSAIATGTNYVLGSFSITGDTATLTSTNPVTIKLDNPVALGTTITAQYSVKINAIATPNPIPNTATITYDFVPLVGQPTQYVTVDTNTVTTQVNHVDLVSVKTVDKNYADLGEEITYTVVLTNTGNVTATNILFTDPIPNGTSYVSGSLTVGGNPTPGNPGDGIPIPDIAAGNSVIVIFKIKVD